MKSERARLKYIACIFTELGHFSCCRLLNCKSHAIGTKLDVFGLYFSFDSFKYINFNLKSNLPSLFSEQTTVLGRILELIFLEC